MTKLLEIAFKEASSLPEPEQNKLARKFLDDVHNTKEKIDRTPEKPTTSFVKSRWARIADKISEESLLRGKSEGVNRLVREFRDNFSL